MNGGGVSHSGPLLVLDEEKKKFVAQHFSVLRHRGSCSMSSSSPRLFFCCVSPHLSWCPLTSRCISLSYTLPGSFLLLHSAVSSGFEVIWQRFTVKVHLSWCLNIIRTRAPFWLCVFEFESTRSAGKVQTDSDELIKVNSSLIFLAGLIRVLINLLITQQGEVQVCGVFYGLHNFPTADYLPL